MYHFRVESAKLRDLFADVLGPGVVASPRAVGSKTRKYGWAPVPVDAAHCHPLRTLAGS